MKPSVNRIKQLSAEQLSVFCYQLSLVHKAGISSEDGVGALLRDTDSGLEKSILSLMYDRLTAGETLSSALEQCGIFPDYMLRMIEIGQRSGRLEEVLNSLTVYYQREADTERAIRRAVAYPTLLALMIALVFLIIIARVLPLFQQIFSQIGMTISTAANTLFSLGSVSQSFATVIAILLFIAAFFILFLFNSHAGCTLLRRLGFLLFRHNAAQQAIDRSRFSAATAMMLSSGLPLDEVLARTGKLLAGSALAPQLEQCRRLLDGGTTFVKAVEQSGTLTGLSASLLSAGFRAGSGEQTLQDLAVRFQEEADDRLSQMLGRFEFLLVLILCISVGLVLLSVMLPLLGAMSALGG